LSIFDVRSFRRADCDDNQCLVVAEVRERLAVSKQVTWKFDVERFNFRKPNELVVRKQCSQTLVACLTTCCVRGFLSFNPFASTYVSECDKFKAV
jgi:hypothetical protein